MEKVRFDPKISELIRQGAVDELSEIFARSPDKLAWQTPFNGGTWLHFAAGEQQVGVVELLVRLGIDVNRQSFRTDARRPIVDAAHGNKPEIARYLLDAGSVMDTDASVRNPLFAAIVGQSPEVVRLLLERGIDASARYNSDTMTDMDATAFALWRRETELARIVALHMAGGNEVQAQALLNKAREVVSRNAPLETVRIVPALEDLDHE